MRPQSARAAGRRQSDCGRRTVSRPPSAGSGVRLERCRIDRQERRERAGLSGSHRTGRVVSTAKLRRADRVGCGVRSIAAERHRRRCGRDRLPRRQGPAARSTRLEHTGRTGGGVAAADLSGTGRARRGVAAVTADRHAETLALALLPEAPADADGDALAELTCAVPVELFEVLPPPACTAPTEFVAVLLPEPPTANRARTRRQSRPPDSHRQSV